MTMTPLPSSLTFSFSSLFLIQSHLTLKPVFCVCFVYCIMKVCPAPPLSLPSFSFAIISFVHFAQTQRRGRSVRQVRQVKKAIYVLVSAMTI
ncbi:hypothetical protein BKA57DRAFT_453958 [Linnemannia elongata]|nr:hypothetical protein BKA57DRAFT_453958 [Linnemannia elongata]